MPLPELYEDARPIIDAAINGTTGSRRRPDPPRSVQIQAGSLEVLITWVAPYRMLGIVGWRVWITNENTLLSTLKDVDARQYRAKVPADTQTAFFISAWNGKMDSIKVPVIGAANTDQYVTTGTGGGTGGTPAEPPPEWPDEPRGGFRPPRDENP